eukprot:scaffold207_cov267-Pinguiococcus_pyrenoidosus.AAC.14
MRINSSECAFAQHPNGEGKGVVARDGGPMLSIGSRTALACPSSEGRSARRSETPGQVAEVGTRFQARLLPHARRSLSTCVTYRRERIEGLLQPTGAITKEKRADVLEYMQQSLRAEATQLKEDLASSRSQRMCKCFAE